MSFVDVMLDWVLLCVEVSPIVLTSSLNDVKLPLRLSALEVVESHVVRFGSLWNHCFLD